MPDQTPYTPPGFQFLDLASGREMLLVEEPGHPNDGWLCYRHPDGQWVTLRKATADDLARVTAVRTKRRPCECRCGYRCGGPGYCELDVLECLSRDDGKHYVRDCDHDFTGPWVEIDHGPGGGAEGGVTCVKCGMYIGTHDLWVGP